LPTSPPLTLPIDPLLPEIVARLREGRSVVVEAPPGAGKTTRVPRALLEADLVAGEIWVLEPRRLPARLAAERVATERGERLGDTVGYSVRFDDVSSPRTRLRFVTEGLLTRRLVADPQLSGVGAVVLDEIHERHVATDLALALLRRLRATTRPDLRLCAMSATLEAEPLRAFLDGAGGCALVRSEGRLHEVAVEHLADADVAAAGARDRPLAAQVVAAVRRLLREGPPGDVLVFLPGASEIRRAQEALAAAPGLGEILIAPLHGEMPLDEQSRAVRRADRRKVVLSTNVAESSITIDGVTAVVDAGLARIAAHSPWTGLPTLAVAKISQASAIQRAGRAGRTAPGRALRLYARHDFESRRRYDLPEVARADLSETLLELAGIGISIGATREGGDEAAFRWFEPPPAAAVQAARALLDALGATGGGGELTPLGRRMLRFPVHPRLGRLICEGEARGAGPAACLVAALISERDIRASSRASFARGGRESQEGEAGEILDLVDLFRRAEQARFRADALRSLELDPRAVEAVSRARRQLAAARGGTETAAPRATAGAAEDEALRVATLAAFPDRVGRRRAPHDRAVLLAGGGVADLAFEPGSDWLVAVDVQDRAPARAPGGRAAGATVRLAAAIEPEWLLDVCASRVEEIDRLLWSAETERVERVSGLRYGALALDETVAPAPLGDETAGLLADAALARGIERLPGGDALPGLLARLAFARGAAGGAAPGGDAGAGTASGDVAALVRLACRGRRSFAELAEADIPSLITGALPPDERRLLATLAPERISLPGGRTVPVHYEAGRPPWIESRLQDFFGMRAGPSIAGGRTPLTLHLLAPNGRAVQVTGDLASFWTQHYPALRRELGRRYPRHSWPEDGATATPPKPGPRR
jgi:ATP-dependent helicase HrpB